MNNYLLKGVKFSYVALSISAFILIIYSAIRFAPGRAGLLYVGLFMSIILLTYIYKSIINKLDVQNINLIDLIRPVLVVNFTTLFLYYLSSFEIKTPLNLFRISYSFGNFMDFITMPATYNSGTFDWIETGHFPFAYAIGKFFSDIAGWQKDVVRISRMIYIYIAFYFITLLPLVILINDVIRKLNISKNETILYWSFFFVSYPVLVSFERGNLAFIASSLMSAYVLFRQRDKLTFCAIIIGIAASIKTINIVFFLLLLSHARKKDFVISIVTFIIVTTSSLFYLFGFNFTNWSIFSNAIFAPLFSNVIFSDVNKALCTTGWDSARSLFYLLVNGVTSDVTSNSKIFNHLLMSIAGCIFLYFLLFRKKHFLWYQEALLIISLPLAFHSSSGDYNLMLLVPFLIICLVNFNHSKNSQIFSIYSIPFMLLSGYSLVYIFCCGDGTGRVAGISIKSILVPYAITVGIFFILLNLTKFTPKRGFSPK